MQHKSLVQIIIVLFTSLMLSSCSVLGFSNQIRSIDKIQQGQTYEQVMEIMKGKPVYRRFSEHGKEEWEYHKNMAIIGNYDVVIISFKDGRVVALDSFPYVAPFPTVIPTPEK